MKQKIAIVTGGASGLGYTTVKKFTENNIFTFVIGRDKKKLGKACKEFEKNCTAVDFDLTHLKKIRD